LWCFVFFFSSRRRHTRSKRDWSSDVCSSDLKDKTVTKIESSYVKKYDAHMDRERRKKRRLMRRLVFFSIIAVLMFGGLATYHVKQRMIYSEKQEQYEQLQAKQKKLKQTEKDLTEEIDRK